MTHPVSNNVPAYLAARRNSSQNIFSETWGNEIIKMNITQGSGIEYRPGTGILTLEGGRQYRITAQLGWEATTPEFYAFGLFHVDTGTQIGPLAEALPPNRNTCNASGGLLDVIHTPSETGSYYLKVAQHVTATKTSYVSPGETFMNVVELTDGTGGQPLYLSARRFTPQAIPAGETWKNKIVNIVQYIPTVQSHGISFSPEGYFELKGGVTYHITAQLGWEADIPGYYTFGLFNMKTGKQIGQIAESLSPNADTSDASGCLLDVIVTPFQSGDYCLRMTSHAGASSKIRADVSTFLNVIEVPASKSYISLRRFTDQNDHSFGMNILEQRGNIPYFPEYGVFTLQKDKTYRITAQAGVKATAAGKYLSGIYNYDTKELVGTHTYARAQSPNSNTSSAFSGVLDMIFTPSVTGNYYLNMFEVVTAGSWGIRADVSTFMNVVEL
jgi:hypothetical protein